MTLKPKYDPDKRSSYVKCNKCGGRAYIDIEPFEGSYYYCKKCQKKVGKMMGIC
jgi:DNA-directed RNA polymerase subunit RPC12/RpoP